jgi:hypothetical protein
MEQKDISTWNTSDVLTWLKNIDMTQYASKFELNKINGYDLIYLTKEDLKNLGIVNIHDKNVILNAMKKALLQQLKLNVNYNNKFVLVQLDFDPNFTVEQLIKNFKLIFKPNTEIFLTVNNNEILMPNLKIIDLILYDPKVYKNFKIVSDEINASNYNNIYPNNEDNKKLLTKTPNKNIYKNYYNNDTEKEYKTLGNTNIKYTKSMTTFDNLENLYNNSKYNIDKKTLKNYNNNIINRMNNNINSNDEYYTNYKTYNDYNKIKEIKIENNLNNNYGNKEININKNKLYEYNNINKNDINLSAYRNNYSIKNGDLNLDIKNINMNKIKKEEDDGQKYSSEKRNYRLKELNLNRNYDNNLNENKNYIGKNNYNYGLGDINEIKNERINYKSATGGFI